MKLQLKERIVVATGDYPAVVESVEEVDGQFGTQLKFTFKIDNSEARVLAWASAKFTTSSKLYTWVLALNNGSVFPPGFELDTQSLIGKRCVITVLEAESEKGPVNKVNGVKPYRVPAQKPQPMKEFTGEYTD